MDEVECVVVGAGVIGLAVARALALAGREVLVLEQAYTIGFETSSRNSEVIHGGLYYPVGSLKARSCVEGRRRLYAYCSEHGVPHARIGKLIVATTERGNPCAREDRRQRPRKRGRGFGMARSQPGTVPRAGAELCCSLVVAVHRHRRQPCADARLSGRGRGRWRYRCDARAGPQRQGSQRWLRADHRRRRSYRYPLPAAGQCRRALRSGSRTWDRGCTAPDDPASLFLPRCLLHADRQLTVSTAHLSGPGRRRTGRTLDPRFGGPGALWSRCRMDFVGRLCGRSGSRRGLLRRDPNVLAWLARRRFAARICGCSPKNQRTDRVRPRISSSKGRTFTMCRV